MIVPLHAPLSFETKLRKATYHIHFIFFKLSECTFTCTTKFELSNIIHIFHSYIYQTNKRNTAVPLHAPLSFETKLRKATSNIHFICPKCTRYPPLRNQTNLKNKTLIFQHTKSIWKQTKKQSNKAKE